MDNDLPVSKKNPVSSGIHCQTGISRIVYCMIPKSFKKNLAELLNRFFPEYFPE